MNLVFRGAAFALSLALAGGCLSGCGGGNLALSGPDAQTAAGLGTLIVSVEGGGVGLVFFQNQTQRASGGNAYFYNIVPGRYTVSASLELHAALLGYARQDVDIIADKTVRLSLHPSPIDPTPFATSRPFAFQSAARSQR